MTRRHIHHEPIVPPRVTIPDGSGPPQATAPTWVVSCLDCGFSHDAHGETGEEAVKTIQPTHQVGHSLVAWRTDYTTGYGEHQDQPHPLYG